MAAEEEDDYMSDTFTSAVADVCPGVPRLKRVQQQQLREAQARETNLRNRQKSVREAERESRDAALASAISCHNKGFALLQKMGYTRGQGLGRHGSGRVEPVPLNIKTDRGGVGMEEQRKRRAAEELQKSRKKQQLQQQVEQRSVQQFRDRKRMEREERQTVSDLRKSQNICQQLDTQKGVDAPRQSWYWPEETKEEEQSEEAEDRPEESEDEEEELTALEKLQFVTSYLRGHHYYCVWCGTAFNGDEDLSSSCPGDTAADHD